MRLSTLTSISENLSNSAVRFGSSLDKLSSGLKVNKASDDGSGLSISDKLRTQVTSIRSAIDNGNSAIAMLQIADKSMAEQSKILDTIKAKLIQASTDTTSAQGRAAIQKDINKLLTQLDNIASQTNYNGRQLISSSNALSAANTHTFQLGEKSSDSINTTAIHANTSGLPQNSGARSTQSVAINQTLSHGDSLSVSGSDENFDLNLPGDDGYFVMAGSNGSITNLSVGNSLTIRPPIGSATDLMLNSLVSADFIKSGPGDYNLMMGKTLDLSGQSYSDMLFFFATGATISGADITGLQWNQGMFSMSTTITGTKDSEVSATGAKTLYDLKNLTSLSQDDAKTYQPIIDDSITKLNSYRSDIGSTQNQVQSAVRNLMTQATNLEAAKSTILDVDYAQESTNFSKEMIILSAGQFSLTQANTYQSSILSLLQ